MNYLLENIRLRKVADGKTNAGSLFIQATCVNPDDEWDEPVEMTTFNERMVKIFSQYLAVAQPDGQDQFGRDKFKASALLDATKPLPDKYLHFAGGNVEEYVFPGGKEYIQIDQEGKPVKNPKTGQYYRRRSVSVLTKTTVDNENGTRRYAKGWELESQGSSIMNTFYAPASQFDGPSNAGIVLPQGTDAPLINGESAPAAPASASTTPPAAAPAV